MVSTPDRSTRHAPLSASAVAAINALDDELSNRFIHLDESGYFLISVDHDAGTIQAAHYSNTINEKGVALDPETGKPIPCSGSVKRSPTAIYVGRSAKELGMKLTEQADPCPLSRLDHALYLGREFVRAEQALISGDPYTQD